MGGQQCPNHDHLSRDADLGRSTVALPVLVSRHYKDGGEIKGRQRWSYLFWLGVPEVGDQPCDYSTGVDEAIERTIGNATYAGNASGL